jgi:RsiW-degrading membrane proteinase PrsW (M82 family)
VGGRRRSAIARLLGGFLALLVVPIAITHPAALLGALPALFWMRYAQRKDSGRPEPAGALRRMAVAGALAVVPVGLVEVVVTQIYPSETTLAGALFAGFVVAGLVEESAKALCLRLVVWNRPEFDERLDAMVYAAWAGLGFALVENIGYLAAAGKGQYVAMFVARSLFSVPLHASCAAITGYFAARKRFDGTGPGIAGGLALAVALHGTFDFAAFRAATLGEDGSGAAGIYALVFLAVSVGGMVVVRRLARAALAADDADPGLPVRGSSSGPIHVAGLPAGPASGWPPPAMPPSGGVRPGR